MVPRAGVEPATISLGRIYSIQLSYRGVHAIVAWLVILVIFSVHDGFRTKIIRGNIFVRKP